MKKFDLAPDEMRIGYSYAGEPSKPFPWLALLLIAAAAGFFYWYYEVSKKGGRQDEQ